MKRRLREKGKSRRKTRAARHALAHAVLGGLVVCGGVVLMTAPGLSEILRRGPFGSHSPRSAARALESLYRKGLVVLTGSSGARMAALTTKGSQAAHLYSLSLPKVEKRVWDGLWYMVSFDIPVEKRKARNGLRATLKRLGFVEYQKSLYVYPLGCESEMDFVVSCFAVKKYVRRFYATDLEDEHSYRKFFGIS